MDEVRSFSVVLKFRCASSGLS